MYRLQPIISASLGRLNEASQSAIRDACAAEQTRLTSMGFRLPLMYTRQVIDDAVCPQSAKLLKRCQSPILDEAVPLRTGADGNCLFRAVSRALYGYEEAHSALRLTAAMEVGMHPWLYDSRSPARHELLKNQLVVCPEYFQVFRELTTNGSDSCVVAMIAVSSAISYAIKSYYPPGLSNITSPLSTTIRGRNDCGDRVISVMWSTTDVVRRTGPANINHFVPLLGRRRHNADDIVSVCLCALYQCLHNLCKCVFICPKKDCRVSVIYCGNVNCNKLHVDKLLSS